jgi:hypothetical protein
MVSVVKLIDNPVVINLAGGLNFLGEYSEATSYTTGDSVSYLGSSYVAIQDTTGNLPTNATYWQIVAEKGDQGPQGEPGPQGESGGIFEHVLSDETFVIQERTQVLLIGKLRNEGKITINGRLILRN